MSFKHFDVNDEDCLLKDIIAVVDENRMIQVIADVAKSG
jgi:hypothetical protein